MYVNFRGLSGPPVCASSRDTNLEEAARCQKLAPLAPFGAEGHVDMPWFLKHWAHTWAKAQPGAEQELVWKRKHRFLPSGVRLCG